jgi:hypothetical protein
LSGGRYRGLYESCVATTWYYDLDLRNSFGSHSGVEEYAGNMAGNNHPPELISIDSDDDLEVTHYSTPATSA